MAAGGGLSLWSLSLAAAGGLLVWTGLNDPPGGLSAVFRDLAAGRAPTPGPQVRSSATPSSSSGGGGAVGRPAALVTGSGEAVAAQARRYLGTPYRLGGTSVDGIDCSGLVLVAYRDAAGIRLPHSATQQCYAGSPIPRTAVQAGDIIGWPGGGHSALALDNHTLIMAQQPGLPCATFPIDGAHLAVGGKVYRRLVGAAPVRTVAV